ncbi:MAG TPA: hypothetical protein VK072_07280 [Candidatus Avamphibacillus sp.]|nr:hypothetical protein [Candidatus Avamphibacillus sp.]
MLIPFFLILIGCSAEETEDDLIGGNWIATAGYQDSEAEGEPNCYPFQDGIAFKDKDIVYVETHKRDFEYQPNKNTEGYEINFRDSGPDSESPTPHNSSATFYRHHIKMITEDEIAFEGQNLAEGNACYLERNLK